jgi:tyrosinase
LKSLGIYDHLALIHFTSFSVARQSNAGQRSAAHSSASFLTWHRMNNRVVERYLQEATGYSNLGIPYWYVFNCFCFFVFNKKSRDWQKGWNGLDKYLGPDGRSGDHAVASGPFCNVNTPGCPQKWPLPSSVEDYKLGIRRQLGVDKGFHFLTQAEYDKLMAIPYYDLPPFSEAPTPNSFRNAIEGWLAQNDSSCGFNHNGVHRWIGGTMGNVVNSFHDPIFLLVHCEVDRLFTIWQQKHKCDDGKGSAECYRPGDTDPAVNASLVGAQMLPGSDGKPRYALKGNMFFDVMYPWATKNRDMLRAQVGYVFLGTNEKPNFGSKSDDKNNSSGTVPVSNLPKVPSGGSGGYAVVPLTALSLSLLVLLFQ